MNLLVHVEDATRQGILPSQLESIRAVATMFGIDRTAYVDATEDGFRHRSPWTRYGSLAEFLATEPGPKVAFETVGPEGSIPLTALEPDHDAWLMFGPSHGFDRAATPGVTWSHLPCGGLNSRDVVPIVLWELR